MLSTASPICSAIRAHAWMCHPHAIHNAFLIRKTQNPALRRRIRFEATSQAASNEAMKAGHCGASSMRPTAYEGRKEHFEWPRRALQHVGIQHRLRTRRRIEPELAFVGLDRKALAPLRIRVKRQAACASPG